ncbi:MAG TPA: translocation/assembly module TamB domain-containing protein, partial [Panacibacter sp.]|nr:translocation/assembly module TamB domain-containing protein [Panacibacter sp.]
EQDSLLLDGIIDGNAIVKNAVTNPVFTSDLKIKDLSYKKDTIGNVSLKVDNETTNAYNTNIKIEGNGNDIQLNGKYYTGEGKMDMELKIAGFNLATVKPFAAGRLRDAGGNLKGNIALEGTIDKPRVNGDMHFENAFITPTVLGERFMLPNEKIAISSRGINFNQFTLVDSSGNKAIINGDVLTTDFKNYKFALGLNADDFSLINSTQADNATFYGKLNVDANIQINGDMQAPAIDANINVNKSTDFTFILPGDDPEVQERAGVVNFVDMDAPQDALHKIDFTDTLINMAAFSGMNLSAIIQTDTAALFTLVIDERSGDALTLKGKANLAAGIDESGKLSLTGNYELQKGSYQLSFNFLKRKFDIQKGSLITWTGDPTSATVDITALYEVKAPTIDLVEAQLSSTELNKYKQRIPVQVFLKMKGELLKPQITFDIVLPPDQISQWSVVDDKLEQIRTDESELNKQVFALLLLNRFVGEDITKSAAGSTSTATLVRQSVSGILADQLNKIAGDLIKGVDLNFGIDSEDDYTTGTQQTRTDLTVGVSKSLFDNRVKVSVGSSFALEGNSNTNQAASNIAGDVAVDYQVTKDGRYMLRAYRKNNYEGVVEGEVIETGLTFILTFEYDQFRQLFQKKDPAVKADRKQQKQERKQGKNEQ